jgi:hypothetical protein
MNRPYNVSIAPVSHKPRDTRLRRIVPPSYLDLKLSWQPLQVLPVGPKAALS